MNRAAGLQEGHKPKMKKDNRKGQKVRMTKLGKDKNENDKTRKGQKVRERLGGTCDVI